MRQKSFPTEKVLFEIYQSLTLSIKMQTKGRSTVESYLKRYKYFRYYNEYFIFIKDKQEEKIEEKFLNINYLIASNNNVYPKHRGLYAYKIVFPFMIFGLDTLRDYCMSSWYESKILLDIFPTRKNIITKILKDL